MQGGGHKEVRTKRKSRRKTGRKTLIIVAAVAVAALCAGGGAAAWVLFGEKPSAGEVVQEYFAYLSEGKYSEMYTLLDDASREKISEEDFVSRNRTIYEGIEASGIQAKLPEDEEEGRKDTEVVLYEVTMDTCAGEAEYQNQMVLNKNKDGQYRIQWDSTLIFPALQDGYTVSVSTVSAKRGTIFDRNGNVLAAQGQVAEAGLVPGKMSENPDQDIAQIAEILGISEESIRNSLSASYVQEDTFVPLKQFSSEDTEKEEKLLAIPGVLINDAEERVYPLGEAAGHLTGYVQAVTAEDLEEKAEEGYTATSVIGKSGLEAVYEDQLRATDGIAVNILDGEGRTVDCVASIEAEDGQDVYVTIDAEMQKNAYEQFKNDRGTAVAMDPFKGEVLALVSTPSYDPNEFVMGLSEERWNELNESEDMPLMNRFQSTWVPGSTFKSITAAIGVDSGKTDPAANMGYVGLRWRKMKAGEIIL